MNTGLKIFGWLLTVGGFQIIFCSAISAELNEDEILAGIEARIEKHRKVDAVLSVVDADGRPVSGAEVAVEQTRHGFLFGSNIYRWGKQDDEKLEAAYRRQFAELLNYATLAFYWPGYEKQRDKPNHEYTERVAQWCRQHDIITKGHPLAWNYAEPGWLPDDAEQIRRLQMARIEDCVKRFTGLIDRWDVVNEVTHFDRKPFSDRSPKLTGMWKKVGRMEFTRECFLHARKAGPKAMLLINDYRTGDGYRQVVEQLVDADGKPMYDVIGIQSHMHGGAWPTKTIWQVCERFARFGVPLHFTETTILSGHRSWNGPKNADWVSTPEGEAYQAREVVRFYSVLFSHPAVEAITWWDFSDLHSWKRAPAGFIRKDMTPKPAFVELKKLIKQKWWTEKKLRTGAGGSARFRGFIGDYKITVSRGGKQAGVEEFTLLKDGENRCVVKLK